MTRFRKLAKILALMAAMTFAAACGSGGSSYEPPADSWDTSDNPIE